MLSILSGVICALEPVTQKYGHVADHAFEIPLSKKPSVSFSKNYFF